LVALVFAGLTYLATGLVTGFMVALAAFFTAIGLVTLTFLAFKASAL
jgi:hypothetical protein